MKLMWYLHFTLGSPAYKIQVNTIVLSQLKSKTLFMTYLYKGVAIVASKIISNH